MTLSTYQFSNQIWKSVKSFSMDKMINIWRNLKSFQTWVSLLWETLKSTSCNTIICIHHLQLYWLCHQTSQWYFVSIKQVFVFLKATHMLGGVHLFFWGNWTSLTESQINKQLTDSSEGFGASEITKFYRSFPPFSTWSPKRQLKKFPLKLRKNKLKPELMKTKL